MGKSQVKKKTRDRRHNPLRVPDSHLGAGKGEGNANPSKEKQMLPILDKLRSPQYSDRTWACAAICNLIQNDAAIRRLFQGKNVVGALIERLSDSVDEVVVEASGALRNLAIDGGHELCGEMFNKGIMSHLTVLKLKISSTIESILGPTAVQTKLSDADRLARKHLLALTENVVCLIWSLAEANHKTLQAANAAGVEELLVRIIAGREIMGICVTLAAAQALYSLSQDNPPFRQKIIRQSEALKALVQVASGSSKVDGDWKGKAKQANGDAEDLEDDGRLLLTRLLVCGVLRNVVDAGSRADEVVDIAGLTNSTMLTVINDLLNLNVESVVARVSEQVAKVPQEDMTVKLAKEIKTDHRSPAEIALEAVERTLNTVSVALEILTGICAGLEDLDLEDGAEEIVDGFQEEDDALMEDGVIDDEALIAAEPELDSAMTWHNVQPQVKSAGLLLRLLSDMQLPLRLATLAQVTPLSFPPATNQPSLHPPTTTALSILHVRALEALNNLLLTASAAIPSGTSDVSRITSLIPGQALWDGLFQILGAIGADSATIASKGQEMRLEVLQMTMGCLWGLEKVASSSISTSQAQIQAIMDMLQHLTSTFARTRCIETLALLALRPSVSLEQNNAVGSWLMQLFGSDTSIDTSLAVINAVIDIYADEERDYDRPNFVQNGFLGVLTGSVARLHTKIKAIDKRKDRELKVRADEAYENLIAFIKYRRNLRL